MLLSVEGVIKAAMARGEFDDLPGRGEPLEITDLSMVPEEHRLAFRVLKEAGVVPPEVAGLQELARLREAIANTSDPDHKTALERELYSKESLIKLKLEQFRRR